MSLLERLHSLGFKHDATLEHITRTDFEVEGIPPSLAIGVTTMCKELLRVKRGENADFKFILGHPSLRPTFTAERMTLFSFLFEETGYDQVPASLKKMGLQTLLECCVALPSLVRMGFAKDLLAQGHDAKTLFLTAAEGKIDVKVLPATNRKTKPETPLHPLPSLWPRHRMHPEYPHTTSPN